jgi:hypothetical protein
VFGSEEELGVLLLSLQMDPEAMRLGVNDEWWGRPLG